MKINLSLQAILKAKIDLQRFGIVGGIGFAVDAVLLQFLVGVAHWLPYYARMISFSMAVTVTFALNRLWTFQHSSISSERSAYIRYLLVQFIGALINLAVFYTCLALFPILRNWPAIALALGSATALPFTFGISRNFVFIETPFALDYQKSSKLT